MIIRPLTEAQAKMLTWIIGYQRTMGRAPTIREIGDARGIKSTNGVGDHLKALERKGYIQRDASLSRSIIVLRNAEGEDLAEIAGEDKDAIIAAPVARIAELEEQLAQVSDQDLRLAELAAEGLTLEEIAEQAGLPALAARRAIARIGLVVEERRGGVA